MNKKFIPAAFSFLVAAFGFVACDGNDETNPTDTIRPDTTDTTNPGDTTPPGDTTDATTPPVDTIAPPDVPDTVEQQNTVKAAQVLAEAVTCDPAGFTDIEPAFTLENVVVTSPRFDFGPTADPASFDGYFVADQDGGAYSGIVLRIPAANRPATALVPGDVVDAAGQLKDVFCWTQLEANTITVKTPVTAPSPVTVVPASDVAQEAYESMLVKVTDVTLEPASAQGGLKFGDVGVGFYSSFDTGFIGLSAGSTYDITGVIRINFNAFQIVPRYPSDVVLKSATTASITDIQGNTDSKDCTLDTSAECPQGSGTSCINFFEDYSLTGVVMSDVFTITATLNGFFIAAEGSQAPFSGILVNGSSTSVNNSPALIPLGAVTVGDKVLLAGAHNEFFCHTQFRANSMTKTGTATPVDALNIDGQSDLEQFEGMLVELTNVTVTGDDGFGAATTDKVVLIDKALLGSSFAVPATSTVVPALRGFLTYSFNKYRISPRSAADYATTP